jgi:methylmalonyl-CoA mutase N-terminal domain/subunit
MSAVEEHQAKSLLPCYRPEDANIDYDADLGDPGTYPYTRGARPPAPRREQSGNDDQMIRELSGEGHAARSNEQFHYLLEHGATGLDVIGDTPTQAWLDPDHPYAQHTVGNQGVSICRAQDFEELYDGIPLDRVSVSHSVPAGLGIAGFYMGATHHGFDPGVLRGSTILGPLFCEDTCYSSRLPLELQMRLAVDTIIFSTARMPKFHPFVEDTYYISDGSVEAVEEMALGFLELREIVRRVIERGVGVDQFAPRIALLVNCRMNFFEEVAKIRASRRLYARMMRDEFGARDPRSLAINITAHTSGATMTAEQLVNNVVRGAVQTVAMSMAGVRAMEISAFDEAIRTPTPEAHLVGLRTQQIVQLESRVGDVADPLGGSYYVEALTSDLEQAIADRIRTIESLGSMSDLSHQGFFRSIFCEAMVERSREVDEGRRPVVGVNVHQVDAAQDTLLRELAEGRIEPFYEIGEAIRTWRPTRNQKLLAAALDNLERVTRDPDGVTCEAIVEALEAEATIGECIGVMREVYGAPYDPFGATERPR